MKRAVAGLVAGLCLVSGASAAKPKGVDLRAERQRADAYAQGQADARDSFFYKRLGVEKLRGRRSYNYFLAWYGQGRKTLCEYHRWPHVVVYNSGAMRTFDWRSNNENCHPISSP
jgi:hypothetical protein